MIVSIQGYKGSFHHQVASEIWGDTELCERGAFTEVFADVKEDRAEFGVIAIENSIAGAILENYDRVRDSGLHVVGEYYLRIMHNLIVYPGVKLDEVAEVWSHPMAIKQCKEFLDSQPQISQREVDDTAGVVDEIMQHELKNIAAIAGSRAAEIYSGEIIQAGIETDPHNYTRFLIVSKDKNAKPNYAKNGEFKTSLYIETAHEAGALLRALQVFETFKLSMTMLVSRPIIGRPWQYGFYIDFLHQEPDVKAFLGVLQKHAVEIRNLGTYSAFKREE